MAERRMFAKTIIDSDAFLDMPMSARLLYYDLSMRADDDGFVNSPKKIMRMVGATQDDLSILALRKFIIPFDNGVVVIKHWRINNYLRNDRYKETVYKEEKALLSIDENGSYTLGIPDVNQVVDQRYTQVRLGKDSIDKDNKTYVCAFESLWSIYPRKKEKARAYKCYQARLKDGYTEEELYKATEKYASECKKNRTEDRYIKLGATFFGPNTPFTDYLAKEESTSGCSKPNEPNPYDIVEILQRKRVQEMQ